MPAQPVIMIVDDDPDSLAPMVDAVARRFGADYRVLSHASSEEALAGLTQIRDAGEAVALVIADHWLPEVTGLELLGRVHQLHPAAQRALLVDWGDRRASPAERAPMGLEASMPGVFAVGDARASSVKRIANAVGEGSVAVREIHEYLAAPVTLAEASALPADR